MLNGDAEQVWSETINGGVRLVDIAVDNRDVVLAAGQLADGDVKSWVRTFAP